MANTQAMCNSFKLQLLTGIHNFGTGVIRAGTGADTFKAALYFASSAVDSTTTVYTSVGEVTNTSGTGYTAGGVTVTNATPPANTTSTSYWTPSASFAWTAASIALFDAVLIYNSTQSNKAVSVHTFGTQTVVAGTFTLTMPTNDASTGLIRLA